MKTNLRVSDSVFVILNQNNFKYWYINTVNTLLNQQSKTKSKSEILSEMCG